MKKLISLSVVAAIVIAWSPVQDDAWDDYIPQTLRNTTLLVEKFRQQDPKKFPPADMTMGSYEWPKEGGQTQDTAKKKDSNWEHPIVKKTNKELEKSNKNLQDIFKSYKYKYEIVDKAEMSDTGKYANMEEYRYVLRRTPFMRVIPGPPPNPYYTYVYYIFDRVENRNYKTLDIYHSFHLTALKRVVEKMNEALSQGMAPVPATK